MKSLLLKTSVMIAAGFAAMFSAMPANAQAPTLMRVDVPFAFLAGEQVHPAGMYYISVDSRFHIAELRSIHEKAAYRVALKPGTVSRTKGTEAKGYLVFSQYGQTWVLRGVCSHDADGAYRVTPSKAEIELAKANLGGGTVETTVQTVR